MQARIIAIRAVTIAGVEIPAGGVFATMEFDNLLLAEFFAGRFNWSWFRVELGAVDLVVGEESPSELPEVAALLAEQDEATAKATVSKLIDLGITSIATLAKADAKALRLIVGGKAGELTRAAKRKIIALRHAALVPPKFDVIESAGEPVTVAAILDGDGDGAPISIAPSEAPKGKKPKGKKS
jgi:hypothetical protein